jgi:hypothetical protein
MGITKRWRIAVSALSTAGLLAGGGLIASHAHAAAAASPVHHAAFFACISGNGSGTAGPITGHPVSCPSGSILAEDNNVGPQGPAGPAGGNGASAVAMEASAIQVTAHQDSGSHGTWALDGYTMSMTVIRQAAVDASHCQAGAAGCWFYTGLISDSGSFTTTDGALSPNAGTAVSGTVTGSFTGGSSIQFYADSSSLAASRLHTVSGGPGTSDLSWPASFLPAAATISGYSLLNWSWTYGAPGTCETWVDGIGGQTGDITGVNHC